MCCLVLLQVVGLETALGTWDQWDLMLCLSLIPALLQYLLLPFCPESPRYLLHTRGQEAKAESGVWTTLGGVCGWGTDISVTDPPRRTKSTQKGPSWEKSQTFLLLGWLCGHVQAKL